MPYGLEEFHPYCLTHEVIVITDHKHQVRKFKKDIASLSHRLQRMLLWIHQYNIEILYKPQLFIADWLSRHNHEL